MEVVSSTHGGMSFDAVKLEAGNVWDAMTKNAAAMVASALYIVFVVVVIYFAFKGISGFEGMDCQPPNVLYTGAGGHAVCLQQRDDTGYEVPSYCQVPPLEARCDVQEAETKAVAKPSAVAKAAESMWGGEAFLSGRGDGPRYVGSTSDIQQFYAAQGLTAPLTEGLVATDLESYASITDQKLASL